MKRGIWVLQTLFNDPPAPPPANVPPLEADGKAFTGTVRQILEKHRDNVQCAGCHSKIDPYGLALENFDAIGQWRDKDSSFAIDASGELPGGAKFNGPLALAASKQILQEQFDWSSAEMWEKQGAISGSVFASEDAKEGANAFKEKREPVWKGR